MALIIGLSALAFAIWELLRSGQKILKIGWKGWVNILMSLGAKYRKPVEVSHLLIPPPPATEPNIEALKALGFRRLGEAQIKSPFNPPVPVWVFTHLETQIQAEAAWKRVAFSTYFQEKVLVVTDYPNGEHIEMPNYQSHTIVTNLDDAYRYHLLQIAKFSRKYGPPHPIRNMTDYLTWETVGRRNYATRKLIRWVKADIIRLVAFIYGIVILASTPIFFNLRNPPFLSEIGMFSSLEILIYVMILLLLPALIISRYYSRWSTRQTHKDSRTVIGK